jgi:hypothetical protein
VLHHWTIRFKLIVGLCLLVLVVVSLAVAGLISTYAYRDLVNSMSWRADELPLAAKLNQHVGNLRITVSELRGLRAITFADTTNNQVPIRVRSCRERFRSELIEVENTLAHYSDKLEHESRPDWRMADVQNELITVKDIKSAIEKLRKADRDEDWMLDQLRSDRIQAERLHRYTCSLPASTDRLHDLFYKAAEFAAVVTTTHPARSAGSAVLTTPYAAGFGHPLLAGRAAGCGTAATGHTALDHRLDLSIDALRRAVRGNRNAALALAKRGLAILHVHVDDVACLPVAAEDLLGERVLQAALDGAAQGTRAERRVKALEREKAARLLR